MNNIHAGLFKTISKVLHMLFPSRSRAMHLVSFQTLQEFYSFVLKYILEVDQR